MFTSMVLWIGLAWFLPVMATPGLELGQATSSVCKVCSTTVTVYVEDKSSTVTEKQYANPIVMYPTLSSPSIHTVYRSTYHDKGGGYAAFNTVTVTVSSPGTLTVTVCSPTVTPSDYPTPTYCECQSTPTTTITRAHTTGTYGTSVTYQRTRTGPTTSWGTTSYLIADLFIDTIVPYISPVGWTKTVYSATKTQTLLPYSTPANLTYFYLKAINNPAIGNNTFLVNREQSCTYDYCFWNLGVYADRLSATTFSLINNTLFDHSYNFPCTFGGSGDAYTVKCSPYAQDYGIPVNVTIDCFGNLVGYVGNCNTWSDVDDMEMVPPRDPLHVYNETGNSSFGGTPYYVDFRVVLPWEE